MRKFFIWIAKNVEFSLVMLAITAILISLGCCIYEINRQKTERAAKVAACACSVEPGDTVHLVNTNITALVFSYIPPRGWCPYYGIIMNGIEPIVVEVKALNIVECFREAADRAYEEYRKSKVEEE